MVRKASGFWLVCQFFFNFNIFFPGFFKKLAPVCLFVLFIYILGCFGSSLLRTGFLLLWLLFVLEHGH